MTSERHTMAYEDDDEIAEHGLGDKEPMAEEKYQGVIKSAISDATFYIDEHIAPEREQALSYYRGDFIGNEEEGRSQIVMSEVRDVVQAMMPSLLRVFCSSEKAVEFAPRKVEDIAAAEQATDYINYIFNSDNDGFSILYNAMKDALISKTGVIKWRVDEDTEVAEYKYTGMTEEDVAILLLDEGVEILEQEIEEEEGLPPTISLEIRRTRKTPRFRVECIPPEEFLVARNARDLDTAEYIGHRKLATVSELVAMGYDEDEIRENGGSTDGFELNTEAETRNEALNFRFSRANAVDEANEKILYVESYIRVDKDGDGIAELRKVCSIGGAAYILHDEVVEDVPFAVLCPDPTPHTLIGASIADQVKDLQLIKTNLIRSTLDSLAQVIHPRTVVVESQANLDDVLNTQIGGVIRVKAPGAVQPLSEPFVGQSAIPLIAYLDDIRAARTGITKASQGLDADVLQSTTKAAVTATMAAAQQRLEMVARVFAETGIKRLFKGLLKMTIRHQDRPRVVRLRNEWVPVDPSAWNAEMDVVVNVGLGNGSPVEKTALLMQVLGKQEQILTQFGPGNPLVTLEQYRTTLGRILELNGFKDAAKFFKPITAQQAEQAAQAASQQPPKPDPAQMLAQVEAEKIKADIAIAQGKAQQDAMSQKMDDDRKRDKDIADAMLKAAELELKYNKPVNIEGVIAKMEMPRGPMNGAN